MKQKFWGLTGDLKKDKNGAGEGGYEEEEEGFRVSKVSGYREGIGERIGGDDEETVERRVGGGKKGIERTEGLEKRVEKMKGRD